MQYLQSAFKTVMGEDFRVVLKDSDEYEREIKIESVEEPTVKRAKAPQNALNKQRISSSAAAINTHTRQHLPLQNLRRRHTIHCSYTVAPDSARRI